MTKTWASFERWHQLFDQLCNSAGFYDDASLAKAYCHLAGMEDPKQQEATVRNLNNWRQGRHLPQQRNLDILATVLEVDRDPALRERWDALYEKAKLAGDDDVPVAKVVPVAGPEVERSPKSSRGISLSQAAAGLALFVAGAAAGSAITASGWRPWGGPADNAPIIPFEPLVTMKVGESRPIYAVRGDCGQLPPSWVEIAAELPSPKLGTISDGGLARRNSKLCKGLTPAQAIVFSAKTAGVEEFKIQGDFFKMTVEPAQ